MANFSTVTNAQFDAALAQIGAPYDPVNRLEAVPNVTPNSHIAVKVESALDKTFYISYNDLQDAERRERILFEAHADLFIMHEEIADLARAVVAISDQYSGQAMPANVYATLINTLRYTYRTFGLVPIAAWDEVAVNKGVDFAASVSGTGTNRTVQVTNARNVDYVVVFWGDSTSTFKDFDGATTNVGPKTYTAGTYTIKVLGVGPAGAKTVTLTTTVS